MIVVTVWITMKNLDNVEELVKTKENLQRELLRGNLLFEKVHELQMAKSIEINKKKKEMLLSKVFQEQSLDPWSILRNQPIKRNQK